MEGKGASHGQSGCHISWRTDHVIVARLHRLTLAIGTERRSLRLCMLQAELRLKDAPDLLGGGLMPNALSWLYYEAVV